MSGNQKTDLERFLRVIQRNKDYLRERYGVVEIGIFGSVVRNEQKKGSDLDILITINKDIDLFDLMDLEEFLRKKLRKKVDLVMKSGLKERMIDRVMGEVIYA